MFFSLDSWKNREKLWQKLSWRKKWKDWSWKYDVQIRNKMEKYHLSYLCLISTWKSSVGKGNEGVTYRLHSFCQYQSNFANTGNVTSRCAIRIWIVRPTCYIVIFLYLSMSNIKSLALSITKKMPKLIYSVPWTCLHMLTKIWCIHTYYTIFMRNVG